MNEVAESIFEYSPNETAQIALFQLNPELNQVKKWKTYRNKFEKNRRKRRSVDTEQCGPTYPNFIPFNIPGRRPFSIG